MKTALSRYVLAATLIVVSTQCLAQFGGGGMGGMSGMGGSGGGRRGQGTGRSAEDGGSPGRPVDLNAAAAVLRDRLLDMRLQLMITPEQAPAWSKFGDAVWSLAGHKGIRPAAPSDDLSAVEAFRLRASQAQERAMQLQALSTALQQLYAVLTPEQQRMADSQLAGALP